MRELPLDTKVIKFNRKEYKAIIDGLRFKALSAYSQEYANVYYNISGELERLILPFFEDEAYNTSPLFKVSTDKFKGVFAFEFINEAGVEFINNAIGSFNTANCLVND